MRCYLYSTDSTDPALALNETDWLLDPIEGEYDSEFEWDGRGASVPTLGGRVIHDYGMLEADRNIRIAGSDLTEAERDALESKYAAGGEWHFSARAADVTPATVWLVQFRRVPRGFTAVLDAPKFAVGRYHSQPPALGYVGYKYEIVLMVLEKLA